MVRNYKKKTDQKVHTPRKLRKALELVKDGLSIRIAAEIANVNRQALFRLHKKTKNEANVDDLNLHLSHNSRSTFSEEQETIIAQYCIELAQMGYGLTVEKVRELAFETADLNGLKIPEKWV